MQCASFENKTGSFHNHKNSKHLIPHIIYNMVAYRFPCAKMSQNRLFRFGLFEFNGSTGELRKGGKPRPRLQGQPLEILTFLLERQGDLVTREELRQRLWPADTFVDYDHSLNAAVNKLREALSDSADNPRFIQTIPRQSLCRN
jgi:DNA-binding winged helix-turn-helix (wHTH) protein